MRALGISNRLDQVFDAPKAVMEVLTSQCGLEYSVCLLNVVYRYVSSPNIHHVPLVNYDEVNKLKYALENFWFCMSLSFLFFPQYIGSKETDQKADEVEKLGISDFWTSENHYRWNRSRYGGHVSASVEPVFPSRLLSCSMFLLTVLTNKTCALSKLPFCVGLGSDAGEFEKLRSRKMELEESVVELEESRKSLQAEQRLLEDKEAELHKQRVCIICDLF